MSQYRVGRVRLWTAVAGGFGALALTVGAWAQPASNDLPVGSCITVYGNTGKIVDKVQGGYRVLNDGEAAPVVVSAFSAKAAACTGGGPPPIPAAPVQGQPAGLKVGACVTAYGQSGKIVGNVQGGYRIASDAEPRATPFVAAASSVQTSACAAPAPAPVKAQPRAPGAPAPAQHAAAGCPASSGPAGLGPRERGFSGALLSNWTTPAPMGADGATTGQIQSLVFGAPHPANFDDQRQFSVAAGSPMYPGRVKFTICTDFKTRADYHSSDENVVCYANAAGGAPTCSLAAHTAGLDNPRNWEVLK